MRFNRNTLIGIGLGILVSLVSIAILQQWEERADIEQNSRATGIITNEVARIKKVINDKFAPRTDVISGTIIDDEWHYSDLKWIIGGGGAEFIEVKIRVKNSEYYIELNKSVNNDMVIEIEKWIDELKIRLYEIGYMESHN